jgi:hypothetical protein
MYIIILEIVPTLGTKLWYTITTTIINNKNIILGNQTVIRIIILEMKNIYCYGTKLWYKLLVTIPIITPEYLCYKRYY